QRGGGPVLPGCRRSRAHAHARQHPHRLGDLPGFGPGFLLPSGHRHLLVGAQLQPARRRSTRCTGPQVRPALATAQLPSTTVDGKSTAHRGGHLQGERMRGRKHGIAAVALGAVVALTAAGCGGGASTTAGGTNGASGAKAGGTLYYLTKRPAEHLDPQRTYIGRD